MILEFLVETVWGKGGIGTFWFDGKLGQTSFVEHNVDTGSAKPVCLPPYRASPKKRQIIEEQTDGICCVISLSQPQGLEHCQWLL